MTETAQELIAEAMTALENNNLDAAWHFMRRAKNVAYAIAADEREACAKVCDDLSNWYTPKACAINIRARGQE